MTIIRILFGCVLLGIAFADNYEPFYGPEYPPPTSLQTNSIFEAAAVNITSTLSSTLPVDPGFNSTSIAIQFFSTEDTTSNPLFAYYYTSSATQQATVGVTEITGDTIFRIASVSKLWTVYLWLVNAGDKHFNEPIIKFIPELWKIALQQAHNKTEMADTVDFTRWADITVGDLAGHMSGIARDYGFTDLATSLPPSVLQSLGFPNLMSSEQPVCASNGTCSRSQLFFGLPNSHPIFPTSHSPAYSNAAFQILGYALEKITGSSFADLLSKSIIKPLGLSRTSSTAPPAKYGVIPGTVESSYWSFNVGDETPAGGLYSSPNDLSTFGRSILSSKLLPPAVTRRWLKPISHTSSLGFTVGRPWEIYSFQTDRTIDLFTKTGDLVAYSATIALSPDHNVGWNILAAGATSALTTNTIPLLNNLLSSVAIPALEAAAKDEARKYVGRYAAAYPNTDSSITLAIDDGPGISVTSWTNNGVNMLQTVATFFNIPNLADVSVRLYYSSLEYQTNYGSTFVGFRAIMRNLADTNATAPFSGPFLLSGESWQLIDVTPYGNIGFDEFLFELDINGNVLSIQPRALRVTLFKDTRRHSHEEL